MPRKKINYKARAKFIRQFEVLNFKNRTNFGASQKRAITRKYNHYKRFTGIRHIELTKYGMKLMKSKGYQMSKKGVFIDDIRDGVGKKIKGSSVLLLNSGIVRVSIKLKHDTRIDYIYNFTPQEKTEFLKSPEEFIKNLILTIPVLKNNFSLNIIKDKPGKQHIRFQFGAYGTHSKLSLEQLDYYIAEKSGKESAAGFFDVLTGVRFVKYNTNKKPKKKLGKQK